METQFPFFVVNLFKRNLFLIEILGKLSDQMAVNGHVIG